MTGRNRKLTEKEIQNAPSTERPYRIYDDNGLSLLIRPQGTKIWQYRYRIHGKANIYTIGKVGEISTADARAKRDEVKKMIANNIDPNLAKKQAKENARWEADNSFERVGREWLSKGQWVPKHAKNIQSRMEKDVFNIIGRKPITTVTARDIVMILQRIEARGAPDVAKRIGMYCTQIFDYALALSLCEHNPAAGRARIIKGNPIKNRAHMKENELPIFMRTLAAAEQKKMVLGVRLLALTFVRPGELRGAKWSEIDWEKQIWCIPAARMKMKRDHLVPLSAQAMETLERLRVLTGRSEYLLPGQKITKPVTDVGLIKNVKTLTHNKTSPHGFRHTASTILNEKGYNPDHIEAQLAHVEENKIRGAYNKAIYLEPRRKMMQDWANYLEQRGAE